MLLPEPELVPPFPAPVGADVPPTGPVANVFPVVAPVGTGTLNGVEGFATGVGAVTGFTLGLEVGGAGFAAEGLLTFDGCCDVLAGACTFCCCAFCEIAKKLL